MNERITISQSGYLNRCIFCPMYLPNRVSIVVSSDRAKLPKVPYHGAFSGHLGRWLNIISRILSERVKHAVTLDTIEQVLSQIKLKKRFLPIVSKGIPL